MSMTSIRKLMHTSALKLSQAYQSRLKVLTGIPYSNDNIAFNSNSTQTDEPTNISPKEDKFISETDQFITELEGDERILNEPEPENYEPVLMLSEGKVNKSGLKQLSKEDKYFDTEGTMKELKRFEDNDNFDTKERKEELKRFEGNEDFENRGRIEELKRFEDNHKHESFIDRDDVKKAMLDVYGKANEHMLDQIMSPNNMQLKEISLHQLETQVETLLKKDVVFQEEFPKKVFFRYDANLDGKLNPREIKLALSKIGENVDKGKLNKIMKNYDKDGDGYLSYAEFCEFSQKELFPK